MIMSEDDMSSSNDVESVATTTSDFSLDSCSDGYECDVIRYDDTTPYTDRIFISYSRMDRHIRRQHKNMSMSWYHYERTPIDNISVLTILNPRPSIKSEETEDTKCILPPRVPLKWGVLKNTPSVNMNSIIEDEEIRKQKEEELAKKRLMEEEDTKKKEVRSKNNRWSSSSSSNSRPHSRLLQPMTGNRHDLLCRFGEQCRQGSTCRLAHHVRDWLPKTCQFGSRCKKMKSCIFFHDTLETKKQFLIRCLDMKCKVFERFEKDYRVLLEKMDT